ncbi:ribosomal subunit interface protein [Sphingorhabdus lutea]|uniref:Ribosome hibernation promoting factor n=1 Tax=Sphingorhabdus lutea TaxID=1913578 RepID=A0A1L3J9F4_9SPHN|nr:ribosome-associated translation inhibitor RaiA [Sphingorhabdus lutea]APG61750.1 ribosomal subunit interface protein [Sphingorhabdus lutea]
MDIRVSGHQVETGEALQGHVENRLSSMAEKYFANAISAHATFGRGPHDSFTADIIAHVMHGVVLKGHGQSQDAHKALDEAADKIEKQLRRYKRRLNDRHHQTAHALKMEEAAYTVFEIPSYEEQDEDDDQLVGDSPVIIAETSADIPETSVSDAVMMMDLRNTSALLFKNSGTGRHNMVYRRHDGTIGWVEPKS